MQRDMERYAPTSHGGSSGAGMVRVFYAKEGHRVGSVPRGVSAPDPMPFFGDKLGERLAFERSGTRLYEALLSKHEAFRPNWGPSRDQLVEMLEDEHRHFMMLAELIADRGGDPTAMTPAADVSAVMSEGVQKVMTDPRTTFLQGLEAILVAELADGEGWKALIEIAEQNDDERLASDFVEAQRTEARHLEQVREWLRAGREAERGVRE
jgi:rubrerythrin